MTDEGMALAKSLGAEAIDLQRGMREIQRRIVAANARESDPAKKTTLHAGDGIHLNDLGQLAMAYVLLKDQGTDRGSGHAGHGGIDAEPVCDESAGSGTTRS